MSVCVCVHIHAASREWYYWHRFEQISVPLAMANSIGIFIDSISICIVFLVAGYPIVLFYEIHFVRAIESLRIAHAVEGNIFQKTKTFIERERQTDRQTDRQTERGEREERERK